MTVPGVACHLIYRVFISLDLCITEPLAHCSDAGSDGGRICSPPLDNDSLQLPPKRPWTTADESSLICELEEQIRQRRTKNREVSRNAGKLTAYSSVCRSWAVNSNNPAS